MAKALPPSGHRCAAKRVVAVLVPSGRLLRAWIRGKGPRRAPCLATEQMGLNGKEVCIYTRTHAHTHSL